MGTDRGALRALLAEHGQESVMDRLEPFFCKADAGFYDLAGRDAVEGRVSASSIRAAGHRPEGFRLECVSFEGLAAQADGRESDWNDVINAACPRIREDIGRLYNEKLDAYLGPVMRRHLGEVLWPALGFSLWHSFQRNRWDIASQKFKLEVKGLVLCAIQLYLGFSLAGDDETASDLADLVDALSSAIILGRREGTKDRYIAVVA